MTVDKIFTFKIHLWDFMNNTETHKDTLWQFEQIALSDLSKLSFFPALKVWQNVD